MFTSFFTADLFLFFLDFFVGLSLGDFRGQDLGFSQSMFGLILKEVLLVGIYKGKSSSSASSEFGSKSVNDNILGFNFESFGKLFRYFFLRNTCNSGVDDVKEHLSARQKRVVQHLAGSDHYGF